MKLRLRPRKLCMALEHLCGFDNFALLEGELCDGGNGRFALCINLEGFATALLSDVDVLFPLVECESFIYI